MAYIDFQTATIAAGTSLSVEVPLGEKTLVGIVMPAAWTAAGLTFQATPDDANFYELYDGAGNEVTLTAAAGQFLQVDPTRWRGITGIKLRSGTAASPVNQAAAAVVTLVTRTIY
ncbi:MAG TPA: hypothetical protein VGF02_13260 [Pseudolabrys sp.]